MNSIIKKTVISIIAGVSFVGTSHSMINYQAIDYKAMGKYKSMAKSAGKATVKAAAIIETITSGAKTIAIAVSATAAVYLGWRHYYPYKRFSDIEVAGSEKIRGTARYFGYHHGKKTPFGDVKQVDSAIANIVPYAPNAKEINGNFTLPEVKNQYMPQTRTITDMYRYLTGRWPQGIKPKTFTQVLSPLIYVNGKEADELLVKLNEIRKTIQDNNRPTIVVQPTPQQIQQAFVNIQVR